MLTTAKVTPIAGVSQNNVAAGLLIPIFGLFFNSTCVKDHRRPAQADAASTRSSPPTSIVVSATTDITTPAKINRITPMSLIEGDSSWKMNANIRTKSNVDDLTMANTGSEHFQKVKRDVTTYCIAKV